jgi:predicted acylesterase/phospholipase RssA
MSHVPRHHRAVSTSHDLILSSGFLAFARHVGVLRAIEERQIAIDALTGTSSGALVGALWCAGLSSHDLEALLTGLPPWRLLRPHSQPWRGLLATSAFLAFVRPHLPPTFGDLPRPLAVGVVDAQGQHQLLTAGPLVEAVVASCAMPHVFAPVQVGASRFADGGAADRLALGPWRQLRPDRPAIAHQVQRSAGVDLPLDLTGVTLIQTPRSGASFLSLGDFAAQVREARGIALTALDGLI